MLAASTTNARAIITPYIARCMAPSQDVTTGILSTHIRYALRGAVSIRHMSHFLRNYVLGSYG